MRTSIGGKRYRKFVEFPDTESSTASNLIFDMSFWIRANGKWTQLETTRRHVSRGNPILSSCCDPRDFLQVKLESDPKGGPDDEAIEVHGRANHRDTAGAGGGDFDRRHLSQAWDQQRDVLRVEGQVRRPGSLGRQAAEATRG